MNLRYVLFGALLGAATSIAFAAAQTVDLYKSPSCTCCDKWAAHMKKAGFNIQTHEVKDISASRRELGMPGKFASCHTSRVGGYLLEGHVPPGDVSRLLKEKPKAVGLAVPGMPTGSPGMDIPNSPHYKTLLVLPDGTSSVFAEH